MFSYDDYCITDTTFGGLRCVHGRNGFYLLYNVCDYLLFIYLQFTI